MSDAQLWRPGLPGPKEVPRASQLQIDLRHLKTVVRPHHRVKTRPGIIRQNSSRRVRDQDTRRRPRTTPHTSPQLVKLRQPEPLSVLHDQDRGVGYVHANLHNRGRNQHVDLPRFEGGHHAFFFISVHLTVNQPQAETRQRARAESIVTLGCGLQVAFFRCLNKGENHVGLSSFSDLVSNERQDRSPLSPRPPDRLYRLASGGSFVQDRNIQITV